MLNQKENHQRGKSGKKKAAIKKKSWKLATIATRENSTEYNAEIKLFKRKLKQIMSKLPVG